MMLLTDVGAHSYLDPVLLVVTYLGLSGAYIDAAKTHKRGSRCCGRLLACR